MRPVMALASPGDGHAGSLLGQRALWMMVRTVTGRVQAPIDRGGLRQQRRRDPLCRPCLTSAFFPTGACPSAQSGDELCSSLPWAG